MSKNKIYCDQDGVLADFALPAAKFFNVDFSGWVTLNADDWERYQDAHPNMWEELPLMPHARALWNVIESYIPSVLTAVPHRANVGWYWDGVQEQKLAWCKKHFPVFGANPNQQLHAVQREEKQRYARQADGTPNILIDDMAKNVEEWQAAGGVGIHYVPSAEAVEYVDRTLTTYFRGKR